MLHEPASYSSLSTAANLRRPSTDPAGTWTPPGELHLARRPTAPTSPGPSRRLAAYTAADWDRRGRTPVLLLRRRPARVAEVEVSIRQGTGNYWNGTGFASASEVWNDATIGGGNWSYAFPASSFPADGSYTVRVRARDAVSNMQAPTTRTFTFDATAPSAAVDFPQGAEGYNAAGWDAGCATNGLCGTYSDGTSGVAEVEVSVRRGTGNYWNGTGFSSATEVWNDATLAGGDWELALDAADLPADGNYTVRVRARRRRQHVGSDEPDLHVRHHGSSDDGRRRACEPDDLDRPELRVLVERGRLELRVPHRRRHLERLHQPEELHEPH